MADTVVNGAAVSDDSDKIISHETDDFKAHGAEADPIPQGVSDGKPAEQDPKQEESKPAPSSASPTDSKKRKHSPSQEDDRDWRVRRDEDNTRDRDRHFSGRPRGGNDRRSRGGAGGGSKWVDYRNNVKSDYSRPESRDPDEIRKQVEFYFSDSNLPTDKFLLSKTGGSANNPVPIKVLHSFKRMRHFQPYSAIVEALKESTILDINDKEEVTRKEPLPAELQVDPEKNVSLFEDKMRPRSIYAKGFGEEGPTTQFDIEAFFAPYGPVNAIRLRRQFPERTFKGSVFVEFDSPETAKQFLALENKPKWDGRDLLIMSKEEYVVGKAKDIQAGKITPNSWRGRGGGSGRGGHRPSRGRGGRGGRGAGRGADDRRGRKASETDGDKRHAFEGDDSTPKASQNEAEGKDSEIKAHDKDGASALNEPAPEANASAVEEQQGEASPIDVNGKKRARETSDGDEANGESGGSEESNDAKKIKR